MELFNSLFKGKRGRVEERRVGSFTSFGSPLFEGGSTITSDAVLSIAAAYAAIQLLSRSVAVLPLVLYRRTNDEGRERATEHPLSRVLRLRPNQWQTHFSFWEGSTASCLLKGNSYAQIIRSKGGFILELRPIHPSRVLKVEQLEGTGELQYEILLANGERKILSQRDILHLKTLSTDGLVGLSPIAATRRVFETALTTDEHAQLMFKNRARPSGVLTHPAKISKEAQERLRSSFQNNYGGENSYKVSVLEEGMTFTPITMSAEDTQFIEQRRFSVEEIARIYGVPPDFIGDLSRATFSNIEHMSLRYVVYSLLPWLKKLEEELTVALLSPDEQEEYFIEFLVDGLLRGDLKTRYEAYAVGRNNGWLSANDVRRMENMNPIEHGDVYLVPVNMVPAHKLEEITYASLEASKKANEAPDEKEGDDKKDEEKDEEEVKKDG